MIARVQHSNASSPHSETRIDLDSHADTHCVDSTAKVLEYTGKTCTVSGFSDNLSSLQDIQIAHCALAFDCCETGQTFILVLNQCLLLGEHIDRCLLCPNQSRVHGVDVDDCPVHLAPAHRPSTHSLWFDYEQVRIPLSLDGCTSYFNVRTPTDSELDTCTWLELSSSGDWDPHSESFIRNEGHAIRSSATISSVSTTTKTSVHNTDECDVLDEILKIYSTKTSRRKFGLDPTTLAKRWGVSTTIANKTLDATTQLGLRSGLYPLSRRFRTRQPQLRYNRLFGDLGKFYSDTLFASTLSQRNNDCGQIFVNAAGMIFFVPLTSRKEVWKALRDFLSSVGIMSSLITDGAPELVKGKWKELVDEYQIPTTFIEPLSPWQNRAEGEIREFKKAVRREMSKSHTPLRLWDYCAMWSAKIRSMIARPLYSLQGRTGHELVTGETPDISEFVDYGWFDPIWYLDAEEAFPADKEQLGRWLGPSHRVGQALTYFIINNNGSIITRSTVKPLSTDDLNDPKIQKDINALDTIIDDNYGVKDGPAKPTDPSNIIPFLFDDDDPNDDGIDPTTLAPDHNETDSNAIGLPKPSPNDDLEDPAILDQYLGARVRVPKGDEFIAGTVLRRKRDHSGNFIGHANDNPMLDSRIYEVQFPDGHLEEYAANLIAESMFARTNEEGHQMLILDEISDHKKDGRAVSSDDASASKTKRKTTRGWSLLVHWKDGTTSWETLKDLKESYPVEVAQYAVNNKIASEPAFYWWVNHVLRRKDRILAKVKSKYWETTHKYGI